MKQLSEAASSATAAATKTSGTVDGTNFSAALTSEQADVNTVAGQMRQIQPNQQLRLKHQ